MILNLIILSVLLHSNSFELQKGDLLFQDIDCGPICDAIEEVTMGVDGAKFSHIALVVSHKGKFYALEAISAGVVFTPVDEFLQRSLDSDGHPKVIVGRLKKPYQKFIPAAIDYASKYKGGVYDTVFSTTNDAWYCSELIYQSFKSASESEFFELAPMTFKSPTTDSIFPVWQDYYNAMGVNVPEGEPGINPGGISRSDKIDIVHVYGKPEGYKPQFHMK